MGDLRWSRIDSYRELIRHILRAHAELASLCDGYLAAFTWKPVGLAEAMGSISDRYHETIPGDRREWIKPEIAYQLSSADYFTNRDPLLEKVLGAIATRSRSRYE